MSDDPVISVQNVSKAYRIWESPAARLVSPGLEGLAGVMPKGSNSARRLRARAASCYRDFYALNDVSLTVKRGESVGIIGRNGSGKSTLLQIIAGTLQPTSGSVKVKGRVAALLELGSGFNPEFTGRENVYLNGAVLGLSRREVDEQFDKITAFADIGDFIDQPVKTYSSGMFVRLAFAVATHVSANILLIDEALAVGDIFFQQKCYARLNHLQETGVAIVLVTHGMNNVEQFCARAYLLHQGRLHAAGAAIEVVKRYYLVNQSEAATSESTASQPAASEGAPAVSGSAWPAEAAFFDISGVPQVAEGTARCTGVALCDIRGDACRVFEQGEEADFYYEYELLRPIDQPVTGLVLFNNKQIIVHGKNSLEYGSEFGAGYAAGKRLRFRHRVKLEIAAGYYTFEVGFASIATGDAARAHLLNHIELDDRVRRHCHLSGIGPFEVAFRAHGRPVQLLHHGIANLSGGIKLCEILS
ncbi:MAG: ABC transporter ATP-binding protein [Opitutae bacterium]|nr:ABC transporter ATP-binding protein [Opitutae bacterium]